VPWMTRPATFARPYLKDAVKAASAGSSAADFTGVLQPAGGVLRTSTRPTVHQPHSPRVCISSHPEGKSKSCSHIGSSTCFQ